MHIGISQAQGRNGNVAVVVLGSQTSRSRQPEQEREARRDRPIHAWVPGAVSLHGFPVLFTLGRFFLLRRVPHRRASSQSVRLMTKEAIHRVPQPGRCPVKRVLFGFLLVVAVETEILDGLTEQVRVARVVPAGVAWKTLAEIHRPMVPTLGQTLLRMAAVARHHADFR